MFLNDVPVTGTAGAKTYSLTSVVGGRSLRADPTKSSAEPNLLTISHQTSTKQGVPVDRHLVRFDEKHSTETPGEYLTVSAQLVIEVPRGLSATQAKEMVSRMVAFVGTAGYQDKLLNNEP
jgi:hypothetical protein